VSKALGHRYRTWFAWVGGRPVATAVQLVHGERAFYWRSASVRVPAHARPNDILQLHMIEHACSLGCRWYHMGESGGVKSLEHFKSRFGAHDAPTVDLVVRSSPASRLRRIAASILEEEPDRRVPASGSEGR
jgi:hypothetical protein